MFKVATTAAAAFDVVHSLLASRTRALNTAATIYLVIASLHEDARLREAFGDDYDV